MTVKMNWKRISKQPMLTSEGSVFSNVLKIIFRPFRDLINLNIRLTLIARNIVVINAIKGAIWEVVQGKFAIIFEVFIMFCILANTTMMAMRYFNSPDG
jgi:hypothetical protein